MEGKPCLQVLPTPRKNYWSDLICGDCWKLCRAILYQIRKRFIVFYTFHNHRKYSSTTLILATLNKNYFSIHSLFYTLNST